MNLPENHPISQLLSRTLDVMGSTGHRTIAATATIVRDDDSEQEITIALTFSESHGKLISDVVGVCQNEDRAEQMEAAIRERQEDGAW